MSTPSSSILRELVASPLPPPSPYLDKIVVVPKDPADKSSVKESPSPPSTLSNFPKRRVFFGLFDLNTILFLLVCFLFSIMIWYLARLSSMMALPSRAGHQTQVVDDI